MQGSSVKSRKELPNTYTTPKTGGEEHDRSQDMEENEDGWLEVQKLLLYLLCQNM